ncbi:hypothetical protein BCR34DRAFT_14976 [Clohesyomyces aquaticus]|uniref:Uncharacterized protein n=1 Tax=Clohesyomyces aquaticus TaxID=1231657 RepID=A0A1Y1ZD16_9PLEO|nr:hypothetical protein BCR34DRAFT_14976 [Clohesyomyces aquaticus]
MPVSEPVQTQSMGTQSSQATLGFPPTSTPMLAPGDPEHMTPEEIDDFFKRYQVGNSADEDPPEWNPQEGNR